MTTSSTFEAPRQIGDGIVKDGSKTRAKLTMDLGRCLHDNVIDPGLGAVHPTSPLLTQAIAPKVSMNRESPRQILTHSIFFLHSLLAMDVGIDLVAQLSSHNR